MSQIEALQHERDRHEMAGRTDRIEQIDAELAALGAAPSEAAADTATAAEEATVVEQPVAPSADSA